MSPTSAGAGRKLSHVADGHVLLANDAQPTGAFSIAVSAGQSGTVPTLAWSAVNPDGNGASTQWAVSFSGSGVVGNSIAGGVYDLMLNPAAVTSEANPSVPAQPHNPDTFMRFFADSNGDGVITSIDALQVRRAQTTYNAAYDYNADGVVDSTDANVMTGQQSKSFSGLLSFNPAALEPTGVSATANGPTSVTIAWTAPAGLAVSGYDIQYWSVGDQAWEKWVQGLPATATSYAATAVPNTAYEYEVRAEASGRTSDWH